MPVPYATFPVLLALVTVLAWSGWGKLTSLNTAGVTMHALRLETRWPRVAQACVAIGELALAACLLTTSGSPLVLSSTLTTSLLLTFLLVGIRADRLGSDEDCGCFGAFVSSSIGPAMHLRNAVLVALGATAAVSAASGAVPSTAVSVMAGDPFAACAVGLAVVGMATVGASPSGKERTMPSPLTGDAAALIDPAGTVVDPVQRALRGRAQLLVFVRVGCGSCLRAVQAVAEAHAELAPLVDARVVLSVGDGVRVETPQEYASAPVHFDTAEGVARRLGVAHERPFALLLGTDGTTLEAPALDISEVIRLIDAVLAAAREIARAPGTNR